MFIEHAFTQSLSKVHRTYCIVINEVRMRPDCSRAWIKCHCCKRNSIPNDSDVFEGLLVLWKKIVKCFLKILNK